MKIITVKDYTYRIDLEQVLATIGMAERMYVKISLILLKLMNPQTYASTEI